MEKGQAIVIRENTKVDGWVVDRINIDYIYDPTVRKSRRVEYHVDEPLTVETYRVSTIERVTPQATQLVVEGQKFAAQGYPYGRRYGRATSGIARVYPRFSTVQAKYDHDAYEKASEGWTDAAHDARSRVYIEGATEHERTVRFAERVQAAIAAFPDVLTDDDYQKACDEALETLHKVLVRRLTDGIDARCRRAPLAAPALREATKRLRAALPPVERRDYSYWRGEGTVEEKAPEPEPEIDLPLFGGS